MFEKSLRPQIHRKLFVRSLSIALLISIMAYGALKSFHLPYHYFSPSYLISYEFGFVKRGLIGELTRILLGDLRYKYDVIAIIGTASVVVFLLFFAALGLSNKIPPFWSAAFASTPGFYYVTGSTGALEIYCYIMFFCGASVIIKSKRIMAMSCTLASSIILCTLIHEASLLMTAPLLVFAYLTKIKQNKYLPNSEFAKNFLALFLAAALFSVLLAQLGAVDFETKIKLYNSAAIKSNFSPSSFPFEVITYSTSENIFAVSMFYRGGEAFYVASLIFLIALTFAFPFIYFTIRWFVKNRQYSIATCALFSSISPVFLHLVGTDYMRWSAYVILNSFFVWAILIHTDDEAKNAAENNLWLPVSAIIIIIGINSPYLLRSGPIRSTNQILTTIPSEIRSSVNIRNQFGDILTPPENPSEFCRKRRKNGMWCDFNNTQSNS